MESIRIHKQGGTRVPIERYTPERKAEFLSSLPTCLNEPALSAAYNGSRLLFHRHLHAGLFRKLLRLVVPRVHMPDHAHPRIGS